MIIEAIFLMIATLPQTAKTPSDTFFCTQSWSGVQNGHGGLGVIETDEVSRQVASSLTVWTPDLKAVWRGSKNAISVSGLPASLTLDPLSLPESVQFPVSIELFVDGTSAGRFLFTDASEHIVDMGKDREARRWGQDALVVAARPGVRIPTIELATFWGAAALTVVATDRDGSRSTVKTLVLPNWKHVTNLAAASFSALERKRLAGECRPVQQVVAID